MSDQLVTIYRMERNGEGVYRDCSINGQSAHDEAGLADDNERHPLPWKDFGTWHDEISSKIGAEPEDALYGLRRSA